MKLIPADDDIKAANFPDIRHVKINRVESLRAEEDAPIGSPWKVCTPEAVREFTAVGFSFARDVQAATGVPSGNHHPHFVVGSVLENRQLFFPSAAKSRL